MFYEFLKTHHKKVIWLVVPGTLIQGYLSSYRHVEAADEIKEINLSNVLVQGCAAPSITIPGGIILAWGSEFNSSVTEP